MKNNSDTAPQSPRDILDELETLVAEAEEMAAESAASASNGVESLRDRFEAVKERFRELYDDARDGLATGAESTGRLVRSNPVRSLALAAGVGLIVGVMLGRRK